MLPHSEVALGSAPGITPTWQTWAMGIYLGICLIALTHSPDYLHYTEDASVEQGEGIDAKAEFEKNVNAAPIYVKLAFLGVIVAGCYCALTAPSDVRIRFGSPVFVLAMICLALIVASAFWSIDSRKTVRELVRVIAFVAFAFACARRFRPQEICLMMGTMAFCSVGFSCAAELATGHFRPWASNYRLSGTIHTNALASHAAIVAVASFVFQQRARRPWLLRTVCLAAILVIILSKTRGALATTFVGMVASFVLRTSLRTAAVVVGLTGTLLCAALFLFALGGPQAQTKLNKAMLLGRSEGATTLTGRLPLWETVWKESKDNHLLGYGYGAFWTTQNLEMLNDELEWYPNHAHSAYIHTILDTGLVGLACMITLAIASLVSAARQYYRTDDVAYAYLFGFLASGFIDGLTEVSIIYPRGLGLFTAMAVLALIAAHAIEPVAKRTPTKPLVQPEFAA